MTLVESAATESLRTPALSSPSDVPAQIECERRCSVPPNAWRNVRCWPCVKRNSSATDSGTSKLTITA